MTKNGIIRLSPTSGLSLFLECARCFWLHYNKNVHRPRGIFPSLPSGMDLVIKDYFDQYRGALPPELVGKVKGVLLDDLPLLKRWRNWRTGMEYHDAKRDATLFGALDDCLFVEGRYAPLDYKTKGSAPRDGDGERYYQTQLDVYTLLLQKNHYKVADVGYLIYFFPRTVHERGMVQFEVHPVKINTKPERAERIFFAAVDCLKGTLPKHHSSCEYCVWNRDRMEFE